MLHHSGWEQLASFLPARQLTCCDRCIFGCPLSSHWIGRKEGFVNVNKAMHAACWSLVFSKYRHHAFKSIHLFKAQVDWLRKEKLFSKWNDTNFERAERNSLLSLYYCRKCNIFNFRSWNKWEMFCVLKRLFPQVGKNKNISKIVASCSIWTLKFASMFKVDFLVITIPVRWTPSPLTTTFTCRLEHGLSG